MVSTSRANYLGGRPMMEDQDLAFIKKTITEIKRLGPGAFLAQFCIWGNLVLNTNQDQGRGAQEMRTTQATPVIYILMELSGCEDVNKVQGAMEEGLGRALWIAKTAGRDEITVSDVSKVMQSIVDALA